MCITKNRKYGKITLLLTRKWLYEFIDRYVYGYYDIAEQTPKYSTSRECIESFLINPRGLGKYLSKINRNDIEKHIQGNVEDTKYYTTWSGSKTALLMIDIDAHEGQTNAIQVAEWVKDNYFPEAYYEPSTHGLGVHMYILVSLVFNNKPFIRAEFNDRIRAFAIALKSLVADEFPSDSAIVDSVRGTISWKTRDKKINFGGLGKIPRPRTIEEAKRLVSMPIYTMLDIQKVVQDWNERFTEQHKVKTVDWGEIVSPQPTKQRTRTEIMKTNLSLYEKLYRDNPNTRVFNATCELYRKLKRMPTVDEVHAFYCEVGLNTGDDTKGKRLKRISQAIVKCGKRFNPNIKENSYDISRYQPGEYIEILKSRLSEQDLKSTRYRRKIRYEDLDYFLHVLSDALIHDNLGNSHLFCSVSANLFKQAYLEAKTHGLLKSKADNSKIAAMRGLCVKAGLMTITDSSWVHGGVKFVEEGEQIVDAGKETQNRGMRYELTAIHPRYGEFLAAKKKHEAILTDK